MANMAGAAEIRSRGGGDVLKLVADAVQIIELQLAITRCRACAYGGKHGCIECPLKNCEGYAMTEWLEQARKTVAEQLEHGGGGVRG